MFKVSFKSLQGRLRFILEFKPLPLCRRSRSPQPPNPGCPQENFNWVQRPNRGPSPWPHSQNKTHFHPIPSLSIHENSFSCAPAPTPNARLASDAGPSPQRFRKLNASFTKKGGKKSLRAQRPRKKPASFIKSPTFRKRGAALGDTSRL